MTRHKRSECWVVPMAEIAGVLICLGYLASSPSQQREAINLLPAVLLPFIVIVAIVIGISILRLLAGRKSESQRAVAVSVPAAPEELPAPEELGRPEQLVQQMRSLDWLQFERLIDLIYRRQGYILNWRSGANPDDNFDLVIEKDGTHTAVQCKHWKTWNVGMKAVQEFSGALNDAGIPRGLLITMGGYTGNARQVAEKLGIAIVDVTGLAEMLEAAGAQPDLAVLEILHDTRKLRANCESEVVKQTTGREAVVVEQVRDCPGEPTCRFATPLDSQPEPLGTAKE